jgi:type IV pilus assembly protein PilB
MSNKKKNIMELMVVNKLITQAQLGEAIEYQKKHGGRLSAAAIRKGIISEEKYLAFLGKKYKMSPVNLDNFEVTQKLMRIIPENIARKYNIVPVSEIGETLVVALSDPTNQATIDELKFYTKRKIKPVLAGEFAIKKTIDSAYMVKDKMDNVAKLVKVDTAGTLELSSRKAHDMSKDEGVAIIKFINAMILQAINLELMVYFRRKLDLMLV